MLFFQSKNALDYNIRTPFFKLFFIYVFLCEGKQSQLMRNATKISMIKIEGEESLNRQTSQNEFGFSFHGLN